MKYTLLLILSLSSHIHIPENTPKVKSNRVPLAGQESLKSLLQLLC